VVSNLRRRLSCSDWRRSAVAVRGHHRFLPERF
jgi:hypothetical protein